MGYMGVILIHAGLGSEQFISFVIGGSVAIMFAIVCVAAIIEGLSARVSQDGIEQTRIFYRGKFFVRGNLAWNRVHSFSYRRLTYRIKSEEFEARLNVTSFSDGSELVDLLERNLPEATVLASLRSVLRPSRPNVIGRWICVITTFIAGIWLATEVPWHAIKVPIQVLGMLLVPASLVWAKRVLECSSVYMDAQGMDQLKIFDRGQFFVNRRLAWINVSKTSSFLATYRIESDNLCIRVDSTYFSENEEVAMFVERHLPSELRQPDC